MNKFSYLISLILLLSGCATYQTKVATAKQSLINNDCTQALYLLEKLATQESEDQLAYLLDYATALQYCGQYQKSTTYFLQADKLSEQMDYTSISKSTASAVITEELTQYKGDTFEKFFINAMNALNYLQLNQIDDAMVEVRRLNQKFDKLKNEDKQNYELNAFAKYLSAIIWESKKDYDDACIDYKDAYFLDTKYRSIGQDMLNTCWKAGRHDEFNQLVKKMQATESEIRTAKNKKWTPEAIVIFLNGWGAQKKARPEDHRFPMLVKLPSKTQKLNVNLTEDDKIIEQTTTEKIYDVDDVAIKTLEKDYAALVARRTALEVSRRVMLYSKKNNMDQQALATAAYLALALADRADVRQWSFLPKDIQIARISLPKKSNSYGLTLTEVVSDQTINQIYTTPIKQKFIVIRNLSFRTKD